MVENKQLQRLNIEMTLETQFLVAYGMVMPGSCLLSNWI